VITDDENFRRRGFGRTIGFGSAPAVVVIDFMNAFTDVSMPLGAELGVEIAATQELLAVARSTGTPVMHTVVAYEEGDMADAGIWLLKQGGVKTLRAGTSAVALDDRLGRRDEEPVLVKKYASAFFGTDLATRLTTRGIDTLIIAGCTTSGCVRATAVDAVQHGFRPMVVREAVGDRSSAAHDQALFDLHQKYADVVSLADVDRNLRRQRDGAPSAV
jgi:nicotinamidase-related amidase